MKKIVYHASPIDFVNFEVQDQGIHFGSKESAFEAVSRKSNGVVCLYTVELDTSDFVESHDLGYDWWDSFKHEPESVKGYVYSNRYEPSNEKSYVTWSLDKIKIISKEEVDVRMYAL